MAEQEEEVREDQRAGKRAIVPVTSVGTTVLAQSFGNGLLKVDFADEQLGAYERVVRGLLPWGLAWAAVVVILHHTLGTAADDGRHGHDEREGARVATVGQRIPRDVVELDLR